MDAPHLQNHVAAPIAHVWVLAAADLNSQASLPSATESETATPEVAALIKGLGSDDVVKRMEALSEAGKKGPLAIAAAPYIREMLLDPEPALRPLAGETLLKVAGNKGASQMASELLRGKQYNAEAQVAACALLKDCGQEGADVLTAQGIRHPVETVRKEAVAALVKLQSSGKARAVAPAPQPATITAYPADLQPLVTFLQSKTPDSRINALNALGRKGKGASPVLDLVKDAMADTEWKVRKAAGEALVQIMGKEDALRYLTWALSSSLAKSEVAVSSTRGLFLLGGDSLEALKSGLHHKSDVVRYESLLMVRDLHQQRNVDISSAVPRLQDLTRDSNPNTRVVAGKTLDSVANGRKR